MREEIEQTRKQLGETVEPLVAKTDLKGRARATAPRLTRHLLVHGRIPNDPQRPSRRLAVSCRWVPVLGLRVTDRV